MNQQKRKAVYAASLDPITFGHINVIERMAPRYDELIVMVAVDARKAYTFSPEERVEMAKAAVAHIPNVTVDVCIGQYVVKMTDAIGAQTIIRGIRNFKDLEDEQTLAEENRRICSRVETIWVPCLPDLMTVSSSMVRGHVGIDPSWEEQVARSAPAFIVAKLKEKYILGKAQKHWKELVRIIGANPEKSEKVFLRLAAYYTESHRAYHNLEHIVNMLDELDRQHGIDLALVFAVWFHDAIYDSKEKNNEERSATVAEVALEEMGLYNHFGDRVTKLILATKHTGVPKSPAEEVIVDLDLAILGKPEKEFDAYQANIRKEYAWVPETDFRAGRSKILQSFLDRPTIYATKLFQEKYEAAARKNLESTLRELQQ